MEAIFYEHFPEPVNRFILDNGTEILYVHRPKSGIARVMAMLPYGSASDIVPGSTHFYEHVVQHFNRFHPGAIFTDVQNQFGIIDSGAVTDWETLSFYATSTKDAAPMLVRGYLQCIEKPIITDSIIEIERKAILSEIRLGKPRKDFTRKVLSELGVTDEHVLTLTIGTSKTVKVITREHIDKITDELKFQKRFILIIGDVDIEHIIKICNQSVIIQRALPDIPSTERFSPVKKSIKHQSFVNYGCVWTFPYLVDRRKRIIADYIDLFLTDSLYGLLFHELRVKRGLVYSINMDEDDKAFRSYTLSLQGLKNASSREKAVTITERCLGNKILSEHVKKHFESAKRTTILEDLDTKMDERLSLSRLVHLARRGDFNEISYQEIRREITAEDVIETANELFQPDKWARLKLDPA